MEGIVEAEARLTSDEGSPVRDTEAKGRVVVASGVAMAVEGARSEGGVTKTSPLLVLLATPRRQ